MKFLRKILSRIPYGIRPAPASLNHATMWLSIAIVILVPLGIVLGFSGMTALGCLMIGGAVLLLGIPLAFCFFVDRRRYVDVGNALYDSLLEARRSFGVAKRHFKKSGLDKNSEPARLLKEAQEFYSHLCFSAASLNSEMNRFDPDHWYKVPGKAAKVPQPLNDELLRLIELTKPLKDFIGIFNQAMARESSKYFKTPGSASLDRLAGSFQKSLDSASERTRVNSAAMLELEKMLEDDIELKLSAAEPTSRFFGKRRKAAKPSL